MLTGPLYDLLVADLDLDDLVRAEYDFDVVGHYARTDVFQLTVDQTPAVPVRLRTRPSSADTVASQR